MTNTPVHTHRPQSSSFCSDVLISVCHLPLPSYSFSIAPCHAPSVCPTPGTFLLPLALHILLLVFPSLLLSFHLSLLLAPGTPYTPFCILSCLEGAGGLRVPETLEVPPVRCTYAPFRRQRRGRNLSPLPPAGAQARGFGRYELLPGNYPTLGLRRATVTTATVPCRVWLGGGSSSSFPES